MPRRLLATDLDGTFVGDDEETLALWRDLSEEGIIVAFASGRHLQAIDDLYRRWDTDLRAEVCITMVGTEIWHLVDGGYRADPDWSAVIDTGWDRDRVDAEVAAVPGVEAQPDEWQSRWKSSWYLDDAPEAVAALRERLAGAGVEAKVVYSAGRFLDVLPARSGKGAAVAHVASRLDISAGEVVAAGDTGNDLDMMRPELGFWVLVVGNAAPELRSLGGPHVYHAVAANAAGIREGLRRLGWL